MSGERSKNSIIDSTSGKTDSPSLKTRWALITIVWFLYIITFPFLYDTFGPVTLSLSSFPVFIVSWYFGMVGGIISAFLVTLVNGGLLFGLGLHTFPRIFQSIYMGLIFLLVGGGIIGRMRDLSKKLTREFYEHRLIDNKYQSIVESSIDGIILVKEDGRITEWNTGEEQITGISRANALGKFIWDLHFELLPDDQKNPSEKEKFKETVLEALNTGKSYWLSQLSEREVQKMDGSRIYVQVRKFPIKTETGFMIGISTRDITEKRETEKFLIESEERFRATISQSSDGIVVSDENMKIIEWSSSQTEIFGYTREEMLGKPVWEFQFDVVPEETRPPDFLEYTKKQAQRIMEKGGYSQEERINDFEVQTKDGTRKIVQISSFPIQTSSGTLFGSIIRDISEQKVFERHLQHVATHDSLTDLPNRTLFNDRLTHSIAKAERNQEQLAILYVDLDNFKGVNDTYGHAAGDFLLKEFTNRIKTQTRKSDTFARISGDEFIIILEAIENPQQASNVAEKVLQLGSEPYQMDDISFQTTLSIGISIYPNDGNNPGILLQKADAAMYHAKEAGKNNLQFSNSQ